MTDMQFNKFLYDWYAKQGRHNLPWRSNPTPYRVLVSEIMLQQTQVDRVVPKFKMWMQQFPTVHSLAQAQTKDVLQAWQGLGYNSRALRLQRTAQDIVKNHAGRIPKTKTELIALPGIGPYTAGAVLAFAYNQSQVFIETNIRRVFIHHFFKNRGAITDSELLPIIAKMIDTDNPAQWYAALMDYGSTLPKQIKSNPNTRSLHYSKQSKFVGSIRQVRGAILRYLLKNETTTKAALVKQLKRSDIDVTTALAGLVKDGVLQKKGMQYFLPK